MLGGFVVLLGIDVAMIMMWRRTEVGLPPGRVLLRDSVPFLFVMWLLLGPALTAPSLAGERERGLLTPVLLSRLTPLEIVWGKWLSAMSFAGTFAVGSASGDGVGLYSPGWGFARRVLDFGALANRDVGAGAALGLSYSATSFRPFHALAAALFTNLLILSALPFFVSPFLAALSLLWGTGPFDHGFSIWPCVVASVLLVVMIPALLQATAGALEVRKKDESPHSAIEQMEKIPRVPLEEAVATGITGRWDLPLAAKFKFKNPILDREVGSKLRLRIKISPGDAALLQTSRSE